MAVRDAQSVVDYLRACATRMDEALVALATNAEIARVGATEAYEKAQTEQPMHESSEGSSPDYNAVLLQTVAAIDTAETCKRVALESERVAIDAVLERALALLELDGDRASAEPLDSIIAAANCVPPWPIEPCSIAVDLESLLNPRLVAPLAAQACNLRFPSRSLPPSVVCPGCTLSVQLELVGPPAEQNPGARAVTLASLARNVNAEAELCDPATAAVVQLEKARSTLGASIRVLDGSFSGLAIDFHVPADIIAESTLKTRIVACGERLLSADGHVVRVVAVLEASTVFRNHTNNYWQTTCVGGKGPRVYVPRYGSTEVTVFDGLNASGPSTSIPLKPLGFQSNFVCYAAFDESEGGTLYLASKGDAPHVVALDAASLTMRWRALPGSVQQAHGLVVLGRTGAIAVSDTSMDAVHVFRASDGHHICSMEGVTSPSYVVYDEVGGDIFVSVKGDGPSDIVAAHWSAEEGLLGPPRYLPTITKGSYSRPMAVLRPPSGASYLAVATFFTSSLHVYALPSLERVASHDPLMLEGVATTIVGLATEPSGELLLVSDRKSEAIHVIRAFDRPAA